MLANAKGKKKCFYDTKDAKKKQKNQYVKRNL